MDSGDWWGPVHGVAKSCMQLSTAHLSDTPYFPPLEIYEYKSFSFITIIPMSGCLTTMFLKRNFTSSNAFYITIMILEVSKSQIFKDTFSISFSLATYILPLVQLQQLSLHNYTCLLSIATALMWSSTVSRWDYYNSLRTKPPILCLSQIQPILQNGTRFIFQKSVPVILPAYPKIFTDSSFMVHCVKIISLG